MMHNVTIDGTNIREQYNVLLEKGAYETLMQWPSAKPVSQNTWQENDGYEPDLSDIKLDTRMVQLRFILKGDIPDVDAFYRFLGSTPTHTFVFSALSLTVTMRLVSMQSLQYARRFKLLNVQFAADTPLEGYSYVAPQSSISRLNDYLLDGIRLSDYGIRALQGTITSIAKGADVNPLLVRKPSVIDGATYDRNPVLNDPNDELPDDEYESVGSSYGGVAGTWKRSISVGDVTYKGKEITLNCLLRDTTAAAALRNYYALLYNLVRKDNTVDDALDACKRTLYCAANSTYYEGYYKSQRVKDAYFRDGLAWIEFSMTMAITREFTLHRVLQAESGHVVLTENGYAILV